jgi:Domain of unknown function (DUF4279)
MSDDQIIQKAIDEIEQKTWGVTQQFLDIHQVVYMGNKPKIERVDLDKSDGTATVYFQIKDEKFYLAIYVSTGSDSVVTGIYIEPYISVCFSAVSETIELETLSKMTTLVPTSVWRKGDAKQGGGNLLHKNNQIRFEPNPGPDEFEDKISKLLDLLETDKSGVKELVKKAGGYIQVAMEFHSGNTMLGGPKITKETMKRMAALNLEIDFDIYVGGKSYK